jgi:hypothetical protein
MAGLQFVLEDKAKTEQKYKKQIQNLQVKKRVAAKLLYTESFKYYQSTFSYFLCPYRSSTVIFRKDSTYIKYEVKSGDKNDFDT